METTKGILATIQANLTKTYREQEIREKERELYLAKEENNLLELKIKQNTIYAPYMGKVVEILVNSGNRVESGTNLMRLEYESQIKAEHVVYAFIPAELGKEIKAGTKVFIEPSSVRSKEYGSMLGVIKEITPYVVSREHIKYPSKRRAC